MDALKNHSHVGVEPLHLLLRDTLERDSGKKKETKNERGPGEGREPDVFLGSEYS